MGAFDELILSDHPDYLGFFFFQNKYIAFQR